MRMEETEMRRSAKRNRNNREEEDASMNGRSDEYARRSGSRRVEVSSH